MTDTATDGPSDATSDASTADQNDAEPDVPPHRAAPGRDDSTPRSDRGVPYTESQVIMPTVKVVAPFAFTYGLFITFHGSGPGRRVPGRRDHGRRGCL